MAEKFVPDKRTRKKHRRLSGGRQYTRKTIQCAEEQVKSKVPIDLKHSW